MATSHKMKSHSLRKLSMLKRELILPQELKLKVAVSISQVWKNNICFLLLLTSGMQGETLRSVYLLICSSEKNVLPTEF